MTQEIFDQSNPEIIIKQAQKGPGQRLRQAREAHQPPLSIEAVVKELRLTPQHVAKIESDDYTTMGASAFARGYLRRYAKFLKLPEEEILKNYDELGLESKIQSNKPKLIYEKMVQRPRHSLFRRIIYIIFLVAVATGLYWWHNHTTVDKSGAEDKTAPATTSELNQQGVSQVMDPQAHTAFKEGFSQSLPVEVLNAENANSGPGTVSTKSEK